MNLGPLTPCIFQTPNIHSGPTSPKGLSFPTHGKTIKENVSKLVFSHIGEKSINIFSEHLINKKYFNMVTMFSRIQACNYIVLHHEGRNQVASASAEQQSNSSKKMAAVKAHNKFVKEYEELTSLSIRQSSINCISTTTRCSIHI